jgi:hypothetical protein
MKRKGSLLQLYWKEPPVRGGSGHLRIAPLDTNFFVLLFLQSLPLSSGPEYGTLKI